MPFKYLPGLRLNPHAVCERAQFTLISQLWMRLFTRINETIGLARGYYATVVHSCQSLFPWRSKSHSQWITSLRLTLGPIIPSVKIKAVWQWPSIRSLYNRQTERDVLLSG
jgi:hypothetical protein